MMGGGGSVAKQFAAGGTMDGNLDVVGNILSGGRDLVDIFATSTGNVDGSGTADYLTVWSDTDTIGNSIAFQEPSQGDLTTQLSIAGDLSASGTLSAADAKFGSDSVRINGPAGTINASGEIASEVAIVANTALCSWGGTSCFGGGAVNICEATPLNACGCIRVGQGISGGIPLTVTGNISASGGLSATGDDNYFSGNVGIGTTAPGSLLTVVSGDVSIFSSKCGGTAGQANLTDGILRFGKNFDNSGAMTANKIILYDDGGVGAQWKGGFGVSSNSIDFFSGDNFNFWTNHGSVDQGDNRFTILAGGNVGIGTDAPDYDLDVAGTVGIDSYIYHNGDEDTYLKFEGNEVNLVAGSKSMIKLDYNNNTNDRIENKQYKRRY